MNSTVTSPPTSTGTSGPPPLVPPTGASGPPPLVPPTSVSGPSPPVPIAQHRVNQLLQLLNSGMCACIVLVGDCLNWLQVIADGIVDLTITDPSYESLERHRARGTTTRLKVSKASSNVWFPFFPNSSYPELFTQLYRVHRRNTHCYCFADDETAHVIYDGVNPYCTMPPITPVTALGWRARPPITWVKTKQHAVRQVVVSRKPTDLVEHALTTGMGYHWRRADERILFLEKGKRRLNDLSLRNVMPGPRATGRQYPTEKPAHIIARLIANSSNPGDLVLDCFAGSGVVGREAVRLGRRAILIDVDVSWIHAHPIAGMVVI